MRKFDLNIEEVLEDWEVYHAIREILANALDEQALTDTEEIQITEHQGGFAIRDYGRGLRYEHLTQNENVEKLNRSDLIGKFGVGLKDALATFDRHGIGVIMKSRYGDITIDKSSKHGFDDVVTIHAVISDPSEPEMNGTEVVLEHCTNRDMNMAKELFPKFSGSEVLESTPWGDIIKSNSVSKIYINGLEVAREDNFLFSYNIASVTDTMKKALNRERTHVGRTAYSDRVKRILLSSKDNLVTSLLEKDLTMYGSGTQHDEIKWQDVAEHVCKIANASSRRMFVTPDQLQKNQSVIDRARNDGIEITVVPEAVRQRISGMDDVTGSRIRDIPEYNAEWNASFEFKFVRPEDLESDERRIYDTTSQIFDLLGGKPPQITDVTISETMRMDASGREVVGLWEGKGRIIIKRDQLATLEQYAGTLLHETAHARSGADDISREFELELTKIIGIISAKLL